MASHHAIAATSAAICRLLESAAATSDDWKTASFAVAQAPELKLGEKARVTVHLHRVVLSTVRRDRGPRIDADGTTYRASVPLDLHYLVSAWSKDPRTAQELLGWAIRMLADTPSLPPGLLNTYQPKEPVFGDDEAVELVWDPLTVSDLNDVWQVAQARQVPSATYKARMVMVDDLVGIPSGPPVEVRELRYADELPA